MDNSQLSPLPASRIRTASPSRELPSQSLLMLQKALQKRTPISTFTTGSDLLLSPSSDHRISRDVHTTTAPAAAIGDLNSVNPNQQLEQVRTTMRQQQQQLEQLHKAVINSTESANLHESLTSPQQAHIPPAVIQEDESVSWRIKSAQSSGELVIASLRHELQKYKR